jgi:hypothetical protein
MRSRGTVTQRLADVVQALQITHKTGILQVNRDGADSRTVEEGSIKLVNGQIVEASVGPLRGPEALSRLMSWACYFVFQPETSTSQFSNTSQLPVTTGGARGYQNPGEVSQGFSVLYVIPQRTSQVNEVLPYFGQMGFTRAHRQLFLLIDGRRTVQELMRLMGYGLNDMNTLLADLARVGLLRL